MGNCLLCCDKKNKHKVTLINTELNTKLNTDYFSNLEYEQSTKIYEYNNKHNIKHNIEYYDDVFVKL